MYSRDTFGFAMKATYGEINGVGQEIFKDPVTDNGMKKSKKGLLQVNYDDNMNMLCIDQCTWEQEKGGILETVFWDGVLVKETTLDEIRDLLK